MFGAALGREGKHGHPGLHAQQTLGVAGGGNGDIGKLIRIGVDVYGAVGKEENASIAEMTIHDLHDEEAGYGLDAGSHFDDLQTRTQRVGGGVDGAGDKAVAPAILDHHGGVIQGVLHELHGLFGGHTLGLAHLIEPVCIFLEHMVPFGVDHADAFQTQMVLGGGSFDLFAVAEQGHIRKALIPAVYGRLDGTVFSTLGEQNSLLIFFCNFFKFVQYRHVK